MNLILSYIIYILPNSYIMERVLSWLPGLPQGRGNVACQPPRPRAPCAHHREQVVAQGRAQHARKAELVNLSITVCGVHFTVALTARKAHEMRANMQGIVCDIHPTYPQLDMYKYLYIRCSAYELLAAGAGTPT